MRTPQPDHLTPPPPSNTSLDMGDNRKLSSALGRPPWSRLLQVTVNASLVPGDRAGLLPLPLPPCAPPSPIVPPGRALQAFQLVSVSQRSDGLARYAALYACVHRDNVGDWERDGEQNFLDVFPLPVRLACRASATEQDPDKEESTEDAMDRHAIV